MNKIVSLCDECGKCCPAVEIAGNEVKIGEAGNLCVLTKQQYEILKGKVKSGEI